MKTRVLAVLGMILLVVLLTALPAYAQQPGVGLCVPLPDPPLILDWTIRAIKVALVGEIDCGL